MPGEQPFPVGSQISSWGDMPVEGLAGDAEFGAEVADFVFGLAHGSHGEPEFGRRHFVGPAAVPAAGAG